MPSSGISRSQNAEFFSAVGLPSLPEWIARVVMRDHRRIEFCSISSELSNSFNLGSFYAISEHLREGFEGFRTKSIFVKRLEACGIVDGLESLADSLRTRAVSDLQGAQHRSSESA